MRIQLQKARLIAAYLESCEEKNAVVGRVEDSADWTLERMGRQLLYTMQRGVSDLGL